MPNDAFKVACSSNIGDVFIHSMKIIIIIIMVIYKCYLSREYIALSYAKWRGHRNKKKIQIKSTAHDGKLYLK